MGLKTDKVLKNIEEAYRVLASKAEGNPKVQPILEALNQTAKHLKDEKLVMHLITTQPELKPAFLACAGAWKNFPDHFRIAECSIPQEVEPVIPAVPSVSLLVSTNGNGAKSRVTLNGMSLLIGRNPERCSLLIPDSFGRVHGLHAELAPMTRPMVPNQPMVWAIINKGQNGTFVNGQPVYESKHLESGDRVTLGGPVADRLVAELVFEVLNPGDQSPSATQTLLNCDILCVVTTPDEMLAPAHQELLKMLGSTSPSKVLFVVDIPPKDEAILQTVKEKTAILETWIQPGSGPISVETVPFPVTCFSAAVPTGGLLPKEGKALVEIFEALAKKKEDWLIRRLSPLITWHLAKADPLFQPVDPGPFQTSEDLETLALSQRRILKQVKEKAMALVQLGEEQLAQSKGKILDGLRQSSLIYKIQVFAQGLETVIVTRHGQKFMKLQVASNPDQNVGHALQHLCITELRNWSTLEWERIAQGKDDKPGLMQGIEQMISTLHELSSLKQGYGAPTVKLLSRLPRHPQFDGILGISIALPSSEIHFKEDSFFKSIFKDLRSGLMSIGFLATLSVLITGIVSSESDGKSQGGIKYIAAKLAGLPLEIKLGAGLVVLFLFGLLVRDFYGSRTVRRDEIKEKLSKDLVAHFNLVAKNLVEHLVQELEKCLEAEERHLKVTLDTLDEELAQSLGELKKTADRQKQKMAEARKEQELFQKILAALAGPG